MALSQQLVGTSATTVYTSSGDSATTSIFLMNDNAASRTVQVYLVPNGGTAGVTNQIIKDLAIDGADTYILQNEKIVLANGDTIQVTANATNSIYATVSYVGI